jgi:hypothetical protein
MNKEDFPPSARFRITSDTLVKSFKDNVALVHMKNRRIHVLNATASAIWKLVSSGKSAAEIQQLIREEFGVNEIELSEEINRTLSLLTNEGFIEFNE